MFMNYSYMSLVYKLSILKNQLDCKNNNQNYHILHIIHSKYNILAHKLHTQYLLYNQNNWNRRKLLMQKQECMSSNHLLEHNLKHIKNNLQMLNKFYNSILLQSLFSILHLSQNNILYCMSNINNSVLILIFLHNFILSYKHNLRFRYHHQLKRNLFHMKHMQLQINKSYTIKLLQFRKHY